MQTSRVTSRLNPFEKLPSRLECTLALLAGHAGCVFWRWTSAFASLAESSLARSRSLETHPALFSGINTLDEHRIRKTVFDTAGFLIFVAV